MAPRSLLRRRTAFVTVAEYSGGYGDLIVIEHTIDGKTMATAARICGRPASSFMSATG